MFFHYVSYRSAQEAERARIVAHQTLELHYDRIQGASAPEGDLYLSGKFWYVFHTHQPLSHDEVKQFVANAPSCGHALNITQPYG